MHERLLLVDGIRPTSRIFSSRTGTASLMGSLKECGTKCVYGKARAWHDSPSPSIMIR